MLSVMPSGPLLALCLFIASSPAANGFCEHAGRCCKGRNEKCFSRQWNFAAGAWKRCFCDEFCLKTKDCCRDYQYMCQALQSEGVRGGNGKAVPCRVSEWGSWSPCSKKCGIGHATRTRQVLQAAMHGGDPCPLLKEMRTCVALTCPVKKSLYQSQTSTYRKLKEVGKIIPEKFSQWRDSKKFSMRKDIRKNIYWHFHASNQIHEPTNCAHYIINWVTPYCRLGFNAPWARDFRVGRRICVTCHNTVMDKKLGGRCRGDGVYNERSRWKALGVPHCHGRWTMVTIPQQCECEMVASRSSFTFV